MVAKLLEKGLPADPEAERIVLGVLLQAPQYVDDLTLRPSQFYHKRHQLIFSEMLRLRHDGLPIEFASLISRLRDREQLEQSGGASYIASLVDGVPVSDPAYYAGRVASKYLQRRCVAAGQDIEQHGLDCETGEQAIDYAEHLLSDVSDERDTPGCREPRSLGEVADEYIEQLENRDASKQLTTGLFDLDRCLVGLEPESLTLIAARPSNGKSAFGLNVALNLARQGIGTAFFSLEMTRQQLAERLIAMIAEVDLQTLRRGNLQREFWSPIHEARQKIDKLPILIDDSRGLSAGEVCSRLRRLKQKYGISLAIVDYLTRLRFEKRRELRHELGDCAKLFKDVAGELRIPFLAMSQLSRASVHDGKARRPQLSDLRESGNLEEDSDTVIFVHREWMYTPTQDNKNKAELIVAKQRQGPAPEIIEVGFRGEYVRFENQWRG